MKEITILFILICFILSFAKSLNVLNMLKREVSYNEETFKNNLGKECDEEYENSEYNECFPSGITLGNYKKACSLINSEKCQNYFKDPLSYHPICKNSPVFSELFQPNNIKTLLQSFEIICQTDEKNELCPYSIYSITKTGSDKVLHDQCKSKKCTESLIKVLKELSIDQLASIESSSFTDGSYTYDELNSKNTVISKLESDQCKSLHATSGAVTIKINYVLLLSLSLVLFL